MNPQSLREWTPVIDVTRILKASQEGDSAAAAELGVVLYEELRALARSEMAAERPDHTLQPTALAHEAYLRLVGTQGATFENRAHFFASAASAIRRVLVDHARRRARDKRGGGRVRVPLADVDPAEPLPDQKLLALDEALARLAALDPIKARVVELRFFAGMTAPELGKALGLSESTVQRHWRMARAWLRGEIDGPDGS
jgi:RNA polymerase sigma factor (TIGR02999 family)